MDRVIVAPLIIFLVLLGVAGVGAVVTLNETSIKEYAPSDYMKGVAMHPGEICVACHTRFSKDKPYADDLPAPVNDNAVLHIFPCSKPACHLTPPTKFEPKGTKRWTIHNRICENCHPRWNTSFDTIHNTHLNFEYLTLNRSGVECDLCHAKPQGYSSAVARVPPWPTGETEFTGNVMKPDWKGDCAYCHFTIKGAPRVHDVHEPVLLKACPICHSQFILDSPKMFSRIGYPYPFREEVPPDLEDKITAIVETNRTIYSTNNITSTGGVAPQSIMGEFYIYFNEILLRMLSLIDSVV